MVDTFEEKTGKTRIDALVNVEAEALLNFQSDAVTDVEADSLSDRLADVKAKTLVYSLKTLRNGGGTSRCSA